MDDVLTEVREVQEGAEYIDEGPTAAREDYKCKAELSLLRHMALEGELAMRRDQLQAEHAAVTQRLAQARQQRQALVEAVQAAGGELPRWTL